MFSLGINSNSGAGSSFKNVVNMEMPDVSNQPNAGKKGGPSVDVSISPQARAMLNLDTASLAAKGYSSVNIDTDGRPGAEIVVDLTTGTAPANLMIAGGGTKSDPAGIAAMLGMDNADNPDALSFLLEVLEQIAKDAADDQGKDPLDVLLGAIGNLAAQDGQEETAQAALRIVLNMTGQQPAGAASQPAAASA